jgi:Domain of unknown function DUF11
MHNVIRAVSRHKASLAASAALAGGLGAVLLAPGTALAAVNTSTAIGSVTQSPQSDGTTTLTVPVTVEAGSGIPDGSVTVSAGSATCTITLAQTGSTESGGSCDLSGLSAGSYRLEAAYAGSSDGFGASAASTFVRVNGGPASSAPTFRADSPSLSATSGAGYSYDFRASGNPTPSYELSGAPGWLSINSYTGAVSGTVPQGITSFTYSVVASNSVNSATAGPFTISVRHNGYGQGGRLSTSLSCTSPVRAGSRGTCTLSVTNTGYGTDRDVTGEVNLPQQLTADFCGHGWGYGWYNWSGCSISGNTASENLGNLAGGQTKTLTVTFTARSSNWLWGRGYESAKWAHVTASASSDQYYYWNGNTSYTSAWVKIVPRYYYG